GVVLTSIACGMGVTVSRKTFNGSQNPLLPLLFIHVLPNHSGVSTGRSRIDGVTASGEDPFGLPMERAGRGRRHQPVTYGGAGNRIRPRVGGLGDTGKFVLLVRRGVPIALRRETCGMSKHLDEGINRGVCSEIGS